LANALPTVPLKKSGKSATSQPIAKKIDPFEKKWRNDQKIILDRIMNENQNYEDIAILIKCEMDHTWISQFKDTLNERVIDELYKIKYLNKPLEKDKIIEEEIKEDIAAKHKFKGDVKAEKKREEAFRKKQKVQDRIKQIDRKTLRDTGKKIKDEMSEEKPEARRMMVEATFKKKVRSRPKSNAEHQKKKT